MSASVTSPVSLLSPLESAGDPGLFGPDSMTWRIQSDPAMLLGGLRALLLQACHPLAMAGFAANSAWQADPWGRLQRTGEYVATVAFGTTADAELAGARLRRLHARLKGGVEPETGRAFRVDDPDLLLWVHVTETESFLSTYRRSGGALTDAEADAYVAEMRRAARLVGLRSADVPGSVREVEAYYRSVRSQLRVTKAAWRGLAYAFAPPMPRWVSLATPARPTYAGALVLAGALLPRWARRLYGLPALPTTDLAATAGARAVRRALLTVPASIRESPYHRAALERVGPVPPARP